MSNLIDTFIGNFWKHLKGLRYNDVVNYMYQPRDPSSLGVIRFLFGLLMLFDLTEERGGSDIDIRWGNPMDCHFPLFPMLKNPGFQFIGILYFIMWLGAFGIMIGYKFRMSTFLYGIPYWYIFLLDKSYWNNHSYLFGIIVILLMGSSANVFFSLDSYLNKSVKNKQVPYWNYFILKFQFFLLYFLAGLKKTDMEWLEGYSMGHIGEHWVFSPLRYFIDTEKIDYFIVHWCGFILDITIGFWLLIDLTRPIAMVFCATFHLMNSRLFSIGMFPYVCIATMPLFCEENWPKKILSLLIKTNKKPRNTNDFKENKIKTELHIKWRHKLVVGLLLTHCTLQVFLPYSHFITKGYNNWTNGIYGYSWDMMIHSWNTVLVVVKVIDNEGGQEIFVKPNAFTKNDRWSKHADMCVQYAHCLKNNLLSLQNNMPTNKSTPILSSNISIYIDVWCSLNNRFKQRMYHPTYDLLKSNWSPFQPVEWLLPLLTEYNNFRKQMNEISKQVFSWSNNSDLLFIADFPGFHLENYIGDELDNVTLTVLEGEVAYEIEDQNNEQSLGLTLKKNESIIVEVESFHRVHTISNTPSCYMYTFQRKENSLEYDDNRQQSFFYSPFPLIEDVPERISTFLRMWKLIGYSFRNVLIGKTNDFNFSEI
ncbi:vitamin K-dependent gamma-carboxylase isoform X1 [Diorhabda sublineata]|uniref:vitamin K-dependent gamma-carboxylase isoform X1 n=1 Tax=Diorhabda sublineata TaxID=1163346 RepID=UPI0024E0A7F7|nr:vitamin K-dependent gamma-carboxylase isoform X1 [Diorhabda sublineata]